MKIIIIGCGMIGISHLKSFLNSNGTYEIDIIDKKKRLDELKKSLSPKRNLSLNFNSKIPNRPKTKRTGTHKILILINL